MTINPILNLFKKPAIGFFAMAGFLSGNVASAQNTVSGTVYNDLNGSGRGSFTNIQTGAEAGTDGNGTLNVYVADQSDYIVATAAVATDGTYTSSSYNAITTSTVYLVLDTLVRNVGDYIGDFETIKMPAAWANTSPFMTADIATGGADLTNQNFGIQKNGFLTIPDFSICAGSDSLFTWYFRGDATGLVNGTTIVENSGTSAKLPFLKVIARYFTNNDSYSTIPNIYVPAAYTIAGHGGLQPISPGLEYQNPVLEMNGISAAGGINNDSIGISVAFKNTNGQKMYIQKLNNAVLDLDTYESLKVIGYNNGTEVRPLIYLSNGYDDNTTNDMRSFYTGNTAWMFDVSTGYQSSDPCSAWCDYNYNAVAIMEFPTPVDSIFYTARITEPTGKRDYASTYLGSNEITGFNYCPITMHGSLWNDANGNGIIDGSEANVLSSGYYINILDEYGMVLASTQIQADGSYTFSNFPQLATISSMKLQISDTEGTIGSLPPSTSVPGTYVPVSENRGGTTETGVSADKEIALPLLLGSNLTNYSFGIERLPVPDPISQPVAYPTGGIIPAGTVITTVSGTDAEDGSLDNDNEIVITQLPANASMYYNNSLVSLNQQIIGFDPALLSYSGISGGSTSVVFRYTFIDAASKQGSSANFTLNWLVPLPVTLESFTATAKNCNTVNLNWTISDAVNFSHFEIERSSNTADFKKLGLIPYSTGAAQYDFTDNILGKGYYNYRLKMIDNDGKNKYSPIALVKLDCNQQRTISVYPNPVRNTLTIDGLESGEQMIMYNATGQVIQNKKITASWLIVDMLSLLDGVYYIVIKNSNGEKVSNIKIAKIR